MIYSVQHSLAYISVFNLHDGPHRVSGIVRAVQMSPAPRPPAEQPIWVLLLTVS